MGETAGRSWANWAMRSCDENPHCTGHTRSATFRNHFPKRSLRRALRRDIEVAIHQVPFYPRVQKPDTNCRTVRIIALIEFDAGVKPL